MLILAGVSINAIVGDNGVITNVMGAKMKTALANLQEEMNYLKIKKMENNDLNTVEVIDFSYEDYPTTGFLHRVNYGSGETYVFDMNYIDRVNKDLAKTLSAGLMESMGLTIDTANVGNTRGKSNIEIDGSKMTTKINNLNDLSLMPNLTWLKLKDLTLEDINGLQYLRQLSKITFDNTIVTNLEGLKYATQVTGFYLINGSVKNSNMAEITSKFAVMSDLNIVRIRNNDELTQIPALTTLGSVTELWIEENINLTNIYGFSTVKDKTHLNKLHLSENSLTDIIVTSQQNENYGYLLPLLEIEDENEDMISSGNIINMSYLDGYSELNYLDLSSIGGYGYYYEDNSKDILRNIDGSTVYCSNIHYLNAIKDTDTKLAIGIAGLPKLKKLNLNNCKLIKEIYLKRNKIESILISGCSSLEKFTMYDENKGLKSVLPDFSYNSKLSYLDLNKNFYEDTELFSLCKALTPVYENDELKTGCTILKTLNLSQNEFSTLSYLENLVTLNNLYVSDNALVTLTGIENLIELSILDIRNNPAITNVQPIIDLISKIKLERGDNTSLEVYVSGCTGITSEMISNMKSAGVTVIE